MKKQKFIKIIFSTIITILIILVSSCKKENNSFVSKELTTFNISSNISTFYESDANLNSRSLNTVQSDFVGEVVDTSLNINKNYFLRAKLVPVAKNNEKTDVVGFSNRATINMQENIYYKLIVYKTSDGVFVTERLYQRNKESFAPPLQLNGGENYTFVAISYNSTDNSPDLNQSFASTTLSTAKFSVLGDPDFLFYKEDVLVSGEPTQNLNIVFKHKFSQITAIIDASATGYNVVTSYTSLSLKTIKNIAEFSFLTESFVRSGNSKNTSLSFLNTPAEDSTYVSANPQIFNAVSGSNSLYINRLTIGDITVTNKEVAFNATLMPGFKYNLILTIVPEDELLTYQGLPAARINGQIWMRHNLAAIYTLDPDQIPSVPELTGGYYQWGKSAKVASYLSPSGALSGWNTSTNIGSAAWNSGTETSPRKTANDPCPTGFRVPSPNEFTELLSSVLASRIEGDAQQPYSAAMVFTSRRNKNVKLTLPYSGSRSDSNGALNGVNDYADYWTSAIHYQISTSGQVLFIDKSNFTLVGIGVSKASGQSIRCIAQ